MTKKKVSSGLQLADDPVQYFLPCFGVKVDRYVPAKNKIESCRDIIEFVVQVKYAEIYFAFDFAICKMNNRLSVMMLGVKIF